MHIGNLNESTAIEQGINYEKLIKLLNYITNSHQELHSLIILRNGYLITDLHSFPFNNDLPLYVNCCTESIMSALVGIAIAEGLIQSVDEKVLNYFPEYVNEFDTEICDRYKRDITIEHLLKMTTGIEWDDTSVIFGENSYDSRMYRSDDPVRFVFEQPMREEPGKRYNHCCGAMQVLSAILQKVSGISAAEYAEIKLFEPLGIPGAEWESDKNGVSIGCNGLSLPAWGLAKIGQLYLQKGRWEGVQIIPEAWVSISTKKHIDTPNGPWSFYGCGYQWNINRYGGYSAKGVTGQYLSIVPSLNMVVVMMSPLPLDQFYWYETLMETFIIPAARLSSPKQTNLQNQSIFKELVDEFNHPPLPNPVSPLPKVARRISGREFIFNPGARINKALLEFNSKYSCNIKIWDNKGLTEVEVGLDDVYRICGKEAYKGFWENDCTFKVKMLNLQYNYELEHRFVFDGNKLNHEVYSPKK